MTEQEMRQLDAEIHTKVFGKLAGHTYHWTDDLVFEPPEDLPRYSTNLVDAWKVVDKLTDNYGFCLDSGIQPDKWQATFTHFPHMLDETGNTPAEAICRAALLVVGNRV